MGRLSKATSPLVIFGVATTLGVLTGLQAYNYVTLVEHQKQPLVYLLALNLTYWYSWAVLVPGILWMARHYRFGRNTWRRAALFHVLGVLVFTAAHVALATSARGAILQVAQMPFTWWTYFRTRFFLNFDWEMMTYWALIGYSHALDYHKESQESEIVASQLQAQLAEAQLEALQRQLHPHFLFNTLNTISALMHRDVQAADDMLVQLSDLLRLTLERVGTQQVTLKDEIDFLMKYLTIEQARFRDRLQVEVNVDADVLDALVPNLILQPIVENALRHGIGPRVEGGRVEIAARQGPGVVELTVRDNGVGLSADGLSALHRGVGVSNTRSRLENLYGDRHRFEFETPPGGGLAVTIVIPFTPDAGGRMESVA